MRGDQPVPHVINLGPGEHVVRARNINPGAWLHIQGDPAGSTIVFEANEAGPTYAVPDKWAEKTHSMFRRGYEHEWDAPGTALFMLFENRLVEYAEGVGAEVYVDPQKRVT